MFNYFNNNLEIIIISTIISIFVITIYDIIKNHGKLYLNILKIKVNIQNKDNWSLETNQINDNTKYVDIDFTLQLYNHKRTYNSIYNIDLYKKKRHHFKYENLENNSLNLSNTIKSMSGSNTYEKLKYVTLLPYEVKEYAIKIKLTKDEFKDLHNKPIYITYKNGKRKKKINLNKYLRRKKK